MRIIVPSVTMNGTTRRPVTSAPFTSPQMPPPTTPAIAAARGDQPWPSASATMTVVSATTDPTERSMPPETTITVMPSAAAHTIAVCRAISSRLPGRKKLAPIKVANVIVTKSRPSTGPPAPASERGIMRRPRPRSRPASDGAHPNRRPGGPPQAGRDA